MSEFECELVQKPDHCQPTHECPDPGQAEECEGSIEGVIKLNCRCPHLHTKTFVINIGPQTEPQLRAFVGNTANAWENAGYVIQAVNVIDTGAGWMLVIAVGWYA